MREAQCDCAIVEYDTVAGRARKSITKNAISRKWLEPAPEILNTPAGRRDPFSVPTGSWCDHAHFRSGGQNACEFDVEYL